MTAALPSTLTSTRSRWLRVLLTWHRRLAVAACIAVLAWSISGLLHPLMGALQPKPAVFTPPSTAISLQQPLLAPAQLALSGTEPITALRLLSLDQRPYYQVRSANHARYFDALTGQEHDLLAKHAEQLAQHYLASQEPLKYVGQQSRFDNEYVFINRLLPVARVDTTRSDGLRVYVDVFNDRLASLIDTPKALYSQAFKLLHNFAPLNGLGLARELIMGLLLLSCLCATALGLGLFFTRRAVTRHARQGHRRWHAWCGLGIALSTLAFASTGLWHLVHKKTSTPLPAQYVMQLDWQRAHAPSQTWLLPSEQLLSAALLEAGGQHVWALRVQSPQGISTRWHALDGRPLPEHTGANLGALWAQHYAKALGLKTAIKQDWQTQFSHEYGFIFKRLPVWASSYGDTRSTTLYIDPSDATLAARIQNADRLEGFAFAYLHKAQWLEAFGKLGKDLILSLFALANALLAASGLWLFVQRQRRKA